MSVSIVVKSENTKEHTTKDVRNETGKEILNAEERSAKECFCHVNTVHYRKSITLKYHFS